MTFTELETVLLFAVAVLVFINFRTSSRFNKLAIEARMMFAIISDVVDNKVSLHRGKDGKISAKPTNSQENSNAPSIET